MSNTPTKEDVMQQQILAAAKKLFQVYGLAKVTMDDVAKEIGKGRSSLYYYYKNKDEIFDAVVMIEIREMLSAMANGIHQASGTQEKLRAFFLIKLEVLREKRVFFKMLDVGMDADALSNFNKAKIVHHNFIIKQESILLSQLLSYGIKNGELKKMSESEMKTLIFVLVSSVRGLKRELDLETDSKNITPAVDMFTRMAMNGLRF
ncbi:AcrR family transcriptional regulator [Chryseobacterium sp. H1D6B]|uniref:TetR/AcrR family transcriptional regulator n=1 Tax=Chryseobacterium sp. H1D6B TaxID=2940588 RepID=UPI0015CD453B|nr:TetR/AcrR family transcriptional regulator [Chryseobacterium sp. H1D6B]MDH6253626.1 AcrR family transcriptional regulator [Chryseobacterium sp. H1D6B]